MRILLLAILLTFLTVVIHSLGTYVAITRCVGLLRWAAPRPRIRVVGLMAFVVTFLLITHLVEAGMWAFAYYQWRLLPDFGTSAYYSLTSYSTVGFGDVVLPESARLLGPTESIVGVLMLGWSTAVIVAVVQRTYRETIPTIKSMMGERV